MEQSMQNKICLVTGATSGIGYHTALELAKKGAVVIVGGRDMEKTANTVIKIRSESGNQYVDFLLGDLSDFNEIKKFADEFKKQYSRLDVLVNNAGAIFKEYDTNPDRIEMTMALNFYGIYLLTGLLLDPLRANEHARIINVSSLAHQIGKNNFNGYNSEEEYKAISAYGLSKLALMHFTFTLAEKLNNTGITVNAMHPGWVKSNFGESFYKGIIGMFNTLLKPVQLTSAQGADTIIYLASSPEVEKISGKYFVKRKITRTSSASLDKQASIRWWEMAENICKFRYPFDQLNQTSTVPEEKNTATQGGPSEDLLDN
jgi:NAD(P)-dependent dehydrogenase (short-subunit alcohol dehydrogenase family)